MDDLLPCTLVDLPNNSSLAACILSQVVFLPSLDCYGEVLMAAQHNLSAGFCIASYLTMFLLLTFILQSHNQSRILVRHYTFSSNNFYLLPIQTLSDISLHLEPSCIFSLSYLYYQSTLKTYVHLYISLSYPLPSKKHHFCILN